MANVHAKKEARLSRQPLIYLFHGTPAQGSPLVTDVRLSVPLRGVHVDPCSILCPPLPSARPNSAAPANSGPCRLFGNSGTLPAAPSSVKLPETKSGAGGARAQVGKAPMSHRESCNVANNQTIDPRRIGEHKRNAAVGRGIVFRIKPTPRNKIDEAQEMPERTPSSCPGPDDNHLADAGEILNKSTRETMCSWSVPAPSASALTCCPLALASDMSREQPPRDHASTDSIDAQHLKSHSKKSFKEGAAERVTKCWNN